MDTFTTAKQFLKLHFLSIRIFKKKVWVSGNRKFVNINPRKNKAKIGVGLVWVGVWLKKTVEKYFFFHFHFAHLGLFSYALIFMVKNIPGLVQAWLGIFGIFGGPILGLFTLGMFFPRSHFSFFYTTYLWYRVV